MKRLLVVVALIVAISVVVDVLGDLTQSRPDERNFAADTELVLAVEQDRFNGGRDSAAAALWAVCSGQTTSRAIGEAGLEHLGEGRYRVVLHPAVGDGEERKLVGCLEDFTVDRVKGNVETFRAVPIARPPT
jgi:hypothetical protein